MDGKAPIVLEVLNSVDYAYPVFMSVEVEIPVLGGCNTKYCVSPALPASPGATGPVVLPHSTNLLGHVHPPNTW